MSDLEDKLARSLSGETAELNPFLPYLLQDLWELGAMPEDILALLSTHVPVSPQTCMLDLACGKGAVSVRLADALQCHVKGIDLLPEFIDYAREKAVEYGVQTRCSFAVGDINEAVSFERGYDVVILGAVGDVMGDPPETLQKLRQVINPGGYIILDDAFTSEGSGIDYYTKADWLAAFLAANLAVVEEQPVDPAKMDAVNTANQSNIERRANELKILHPEIAYLFQRYIESQQSECNALSDALTGATWLLQKNRHIHSTASSSKKRRRDTYQLTVF